MLQVRKYMLAEGIFDRKYEVAVMEFNYSIYLQLEKILNSQKLQSLDEHDEMLFMIVHQTYELWFKQIIYELDFLKRIIISEKVWELLHTLKRIRCIIKVVVSQVDILETMSPVSFSNFRKYLGGASGYQSTQFREIEFLLGIKNEKILSSIDPATEEHKKLQAIYANSSIWENFLNLCCKQDIPEDVRQDTIALLLHIYKNPSLYTETAELFLDIDEGIQEWRYRHVKMVERIIGNGSVGTNGSSGFEYLKNTMFLSFCPELWKIRNFFYEPTQKLNSIRNWDS